jgi:hypothetical protein
MRADIPLSYDETRWKERIACPQNTLQIFVTDKCNLRCPECFYGQFLGTQEIPFAEYQQHILKYKDQVSKVILLGGEPTLHRDLLRMIDFNIAQGLKTTIYTNGHRLKALEAPLRDPVYANAVSIRIGVHGLNVSEKPLNQVKRTELPVTIVYMLARYNVDELMPAAQMAEKDFNCKEFYVSSIREIEKSGGYWEDTDRTIPIPEYAQLVQQFVNDYAGGLRRLHLATRGVLVTKKQDFTGVTTCRFGTILRDGGKIISPFDISVNKRSEDLSFATQPCSRHHKCVLQKIVLDQKAVS